MKIGPNSKKQLFLNFSLVEIPEDKFKYFGLSRFKYTTTVHPYFVVRTTLQLVILKTVLSETPLGDLSLQTYFFNSYMHINFSQKVCMYLCIMYVCMTDLMLTYIHTYVCTYTYTNPQILSKS